MHMHVQVTVAVNIACLGKYGGLGGSVVAERWNSRAIVALINAWKPDGLRTNCYGRQLIPAAYLGIADRCYPYMDCE